MTCHKHPRGQIDAMHNSLVLVNGTVPIVTQGIRALVEVRPFWQILDRVYQLLRRIELKQIPDATNNRPARGSRDECSCMTSLASPSINWS